MAIAIERHVGKKCIQRGWLLRQALELLPFAPRPDVLGGAPLLHLGNRHQSGMVVLVPLKRQANALDGVGDEANRAIVIDALEGFNHAGHVMAAEI